MEELCFPLKDRNIQGNHILQISSPHFDFPVDVLPLRHTFKVNTHNKAFSLSACLKPSHFQSCFQPKDCNARFSTFLCTYTQILTDTTGTAHPKQTSVTTSYNRLILFPPPPPQRFVCLLARSNHQNILLPILDPMIHFTSWVKCAVSVVWTLSKAKLI